MAADDSYSPSPHVKFYGRKMSTASITEAVLNELGIEGERITMTFDDSEGGTRSEAYKRDVNPNGKVPAIEHDGTVIWEAGAITLYLGEVFGVTRELWPALGPKRGDAMKWICWAVVLAQAGMRLGMEQSQGGDAAQADISSNARLQAAEKSIDEMLAVLNAGLDGQKHLLGEYTLVDTHLAQILQWFGYMGVKLDAHKNLPAWKKRCLERPAIAKMDG